MNSNSEENAANEVVVETNTIEREVKKDESQSSIVGIHQNWGALLGQLFLAGTFFEVLDKPTVLSLTLTCKSISNILRDFISNAYTFRITSGKSTIYYPRKIIINFMDEFLAYPHYKKVTHLELSCYFTEVIDGLLPDSVQVLTIGDYFDKSINQLPINLTRLTLGASFNQTVDSLPPNLTHITFSDEFNKSVDNFPSKLTHIVFGYEFNCNVDHLPKSLRHLRFGVNFDKPVDHLPEGLTHIIFGWNFNQPVDHLPRGLTYLIFGNEFNKPVEHLPPELTILVFDSSIFSQPIYAVPTTLKYLVIKYYGYGKEIEPLFPNTTIFWRDRL
eukprot:TRINITY_DN2075_c0_g2_i2.p1 TRINITY_DN2075_c0_g2~~TRINITY_DN2075_c0_g2_i2.p1  ORF type:complete len:330 (-),score=24.14 TRINITY_DN2075_c0_g2_i2:145-1134(-)